MENVKIKIGECKCFRLITLAHLFKNTKEF